MLQKQQWETANLRGQNMQIEHRWAVCCSYGTCGCAKQSLWRARLRKRLFSKTTQSRVVCSAFISSASHKQRRFSWAHVHVCAYIQYVCVCVHRCACVLMCVCAWLCCCIAQYNLLLFLTRALSNLFVLCAVYSGVPLLFCVANSNKPSSRANYYPSTSV